MYVYLTDFNFVFNQLAYCISSKSSETQSDMTGFGLASLHFSGLGMGSGSKMLLDKVQLKGIHHQNLIRVCGLLFGFFFFGKNIFQIPVNVIGLLCGMIHICMAA